jgi:hypothetical protein
MEEKIYGHVFEVRREKKYATSLFCGHASHQGDPSSPLFFVVVRHLQPENALVAHRPTEEEFVMVGARAGSQILSVSVEGVDSSLRVK